MPNSRALRPFSLNPTGTLSRRHLAQFVSAVDSLRAVGEAASSVVEPGYPLAPHYVVHVGEDGEVLLPYTQAKQVLDRLKKLSLGRDQPDQAAYGRFDKTTRAGRDMEPYRKLLARAVGTIVGKREERAVASLFQMGGTHAVKGEFAGINDFEVVAFLVALAPATDVAS
jgi:hypothetical protein